MPADTSEIRRRSAALLGNEKLIEVVLAMARTDEPHAVTAQQLNGMTGIPHSLVRDVLVRLVTSEVLLAVPKVGGSRSAQYYQPRSQVGWQQLVSLAEHLEAQALTAG